MNFRLFETLHECDIAIGATRETDTILGCALRTKHGSTCAPKYPGTNSRVGGTPALRKFDRECYGVAAAEAEGRDAALQIASLQFVQQCDQDARAGCTDGMAQRYGTAVDINFFRIELQHACYRDGCHGERFIQFVEVYVFVAVPARLLQQLFYGFDWRHHHPLRLDAADGLRDDASDGLFAEARGIFFTGDDHCRCPVVRSR